LRRTVAAAAGWAAGRRRPKKVYPLDMGMYRIRSGFSADVGRMRGGTVAISLFKRRFAGWGEVTLEGLPWGGRATSW